MIEFALAAEAAGSTALVRPYRPANGAAIFPPAPEDLVTSIIPAGYATATAPSQIARAKFLITVDMGGGQQIVMPLVSVDDDSVAVPVSFSITDKLDRIKEQLSLSVTQLAELFHVTRKAVYDWYEGAEPRVTTTVRISTLVEILASRPATEEMQRLKAVWKVPVSGRSFLDVMNDEKLDASTLRRTLVDKLHELSPRLVAPNRASIRTSTDIGRAHLADIDRSIDFS